MANANNLCIITEQNWMCICWKAKNEGSHSAIVASAKGLQLDLQPAQLCASVRFSHSRNGGGTPTTSLTLCLRHVFWQQLLFFFGKNRTVYCAKCWNVCLHTREMCSEVMTGLLAFGGERGAQENCAPGSLIAVAIFQRLPHWTICSIPINDDCKPIITNITMAQVVIVFG